jgi:Domain of unknown function (DUF2357)
LELKIGPGLHNPWLTWQMIHIALHTTEIWVNVERARRPVASKLRHAVSLGQNLYETGLPIRVVHAHVEQTHDIYENRLVRSFYIAVAWRLARLAQAVTRSFTRPTQRVSNFAKAHHFYVTIRFDQADRTHSDRVRCQGSQVRRSDGR